MAVGVKIKSNMEVVKKAQEEMPKLLKSSEVANLPANSQLAKIPLRLGGDCVTVVTTEENSVYGWARGSVDDLTDAEAVRVMVRLILFRNNLPEMPVLVAGQPLRIPTTKPCEDVIFTAPA